MIALIAVVWLVAMVAMSAGGVRAARHRAHAAADLAALAAASHATNGVTRACGVAATVARAAHARVTRCAVRARIAGVSVVVAAHVIGIGTVRLTATARAGPVHGPSVPDTAGSSRWAGAGQGPAMPGHAPHGRAGDPTPERFGAARKFFGARGSGLSGDERTQARKGRGIRPYESGE